MKKANKVNQQYLYLTVILMILVIAVAGWYYFTSVGSMLIDGGGCVPRTCSQLGKNCGSGWSNGCGGYVNCGTCPTGQRCSSGRCVVITTPPPLTASITSPANGATFNSGDPGITFTGSASGGSGYTYSWTSSINGNIGNSQTFSKNDLSVGDHIITFTVTDSTGRTATRQITIHVTAGQLTASITSPAAGATFIEGVDVVTFDCTASGGYPPYSYFWGDSKDTWWLGIRARTYSTTLHFIGDHQILLNVQDSHGNSGLPSTKQITIYVIDRCGNSVVKGTEECDPPMISSAQCGGRECKSNCKCTPPPLTASITSPANGATYGSLNLITFSGSASGGVPPYTYSWTSSRDGYLSSLQTFVSVDQHIILSLGDHIITFYVTDSTGAIASKGITIHRV